MSSYTDLSSLQRRAVLLLAGGRPPVEVAGEVGVTDRTLSRWRSQPAFRAALIEANALVFADLQAGLQALAAEALTALGDGLHSERMADRLRASDLTLRHLLNLKTTLELEARLQELEARLAGLEHR